MTIALAEKGFYPTQFVLERSREEGVPPTDFRIIHQVLTCLKGILEPQRVILTLQPYETIQTGDRRQYLGTGDYEDVDFSLGEFLDQDVAVWENQLREEHRYIAVMTCSDMIRVCMSSYNQVLFYSQYPEYMGIENVLEDEAGFHLYETGGGREISSFVITTGDPVMTPIMRIDIEVQTTLIFENKRLIDPFIAAVSDLKDLGWRVAESPTVSIPVEMARPPQ
jgi:hypothetical protein